MTEEVRLDVRPMNRLLAGVGGLADDRRNAVVLLFVDVGKNDVFCDCSLGFADSRCFGVLGRPAADGKLDRADSGTKKWLTTGGLGRLGSSVSKNQVRWCAARRFSEGAVGSGRR